MRVAWLFALVLLAPQLAWAQQYSADRYATTNAAAGTDDATAAVRRYRDQLASSGYYETSDARNMLPYGPTETDAYRRAAQADAHAGLGDYSHRKCVACHEQSAANLHTIRANNTCRQCHGPEPIASVTHYFSRLNPVRRHAYVCAKCHEGAGASFASYVVHEPLPSSSEARMAFPALFYSDRLMFWLIVGVFLIFIPHSVGWWIREWFVKKKPEV
ncbi:MAG: hypothetical protein OER96_06945 [Gammaproteobacteria bacterium]|nr:hypothetical protein [Gammaproteobacteria bacterium]